MTDSAAEILRFVREQDVKFVRLTFCDLLGMQKNIAVMAAELPRIFGIRHDLRCLGRAGTGAGGTFGPVSDAGLFYDFHFTVAPQS